MPRVLPDGTRVYSRREVGYRHGRGRAGRMRRRHFIKHTAVSPTGGLSVDAEMALCRAFERYHVGTRGMAGIAYSWLVGHSGTVYEGRGWGFDGSHTQNGGNSGGYASCTIGDHTRDVPTAAAWQADRALIADGIDAGALEPDYAVSGHGDWWPKECPGRHIRTAMHAELAHDRILTQPDQEDDDMITPDTPAGHPVLERTLRLVNGVNHRSHVLEPDRWPPLPQVDVTGPYDARAQELTAHALGRQEAYTTFNPHSRASEAVTGIEGAALLHAVVELGRRLAARDG